MSPKKKKAKKKNAQRNRAAEQFVSIRETPVAPTTNMPIARAMQLAGRHTATGKPTVAEFIYTQILDQQADFSDAAILLLNSLINRGESDNLRLQLYRMASLYANNATVIAEIANCYLQLNDPDKAKELLVKALSNDAESPVLTRALANVYRLLGEKDKAIDLFWKALSVNPNDAYSLYSLAEIDRHNHREKILQALDAIDVSTLPATDKPFYHFGKAYLLRDADPQSYFQHLNLANGLLAQDHKQLVAQLQSSYQGISTHFKGSMVAFANRAQAAPDAPIFIMAPPRSGTTLVEQILGAHSRTHAVGESFAVAQAITHFAQSRALTGEYWLWDPATIEEAANQIDTLYFANKRIGGKRDVIPVDKSIENFLYAGLILATWPNARIIRLTRHPLDTILSCYHNNFTSSSGQNYLFNLEALGYFYASYQQHMDYWQQLFPERIMRLAYEDLVSDQKYYTRQLLAFCQLPWEHQCLEFHQQVGTVLTVSTDQVRQQINNRSIGRWQAVHEHLEPARIVLRQELGLEL